MITQHFPAFKYQDFRLLWISELISATGTGILTVAMNWQLYLLTHSALALGLLGIFQGVPFLLCNLIGGNFADVHNRKRILYVTQPIIAFSSFLLALLTFTHVISSSLIYILVIFVNIALAFDMPARGALLPTLVEKKDLASANGVYSLLWQSANIIGPGVGGFLLASIGVGNIYLLDGLSTLCVLFAIWSMQATGIPSHEKSTVSLAAIREGFSFLFSKNLLWSTKVLDAVSVFFASSVILLPIYAKDILHVGPQGLGFLYAAPAVGGVLVGIIVARYIPYIKKQGRLLLFAVIIYAIATIIFGFSTSFILSCIALLISGGANVISVIIRATITQVNTPQAMQGRVSSISSVFWMGGDKLGDVEAGVAAQLLGAPLAVVIGGIGAIIVVCTMALSNSTLREYKADR